jgi:sialate O-acetylesterase
MNPRLPRLTILILAPVLLMLSAMHLLADVRLPGLFSEHMVLQQGLRAPLWGWADPGERVTVMFRGRTASTITNP